MIYFSKTTNGDTHTESTHIRQFCSIKDADLVQADGDELAFIQSNYQGIRMTNGRVVIFVGDDAKFISENWNTLNKVYT